MSDDKQTTHTKVPLKKGYQPAAGTSTNPNAGYQPTTGSGAPTNPPNKGGGGKK